MFDIDTINKARRILNTSTEPDALRRAGLTLAAAIDHLRHEVVIAYAAVDAERDRHRREVEAAQARAQAGRCCR